MRPDLSRRRVVLYSGGQQRRNAAIHDTLLGLALRRGPGAGGGVRMTYLPYTHEGARPYFRRFERRYRAFGGTEFAMVAADDPRLAASRAARREAARTLRASDVVYLAGGNTFHFLAALRRSGLFEELQRFGRRGGVLAGLSAGALILTPDVALAGYPEFDRDENDVRLSRRDQRGLGLVGFEFFPHFRRSARYREALAAWSSRSRRTLYACPDGSGIVVEGDRFTAHGPVWQFHRGAESRLGD